MGFLSPWFLAGLAAIGLPLYLHLLKRHQQTPQKFSSVMFLERRQDTSVKHRRLDYIVLFTLRTLLFLLLVLAFANPYILRKILPGQGGQKTVVVAVDNSFSMKANGNLDRAKQEAASLLAGLRGARAQLLAFSSSVQFQGEPTADPGALQAAVASIEPSESRSSFAELARAVRAMAETAPGPIELHLFSDLQRSALPAAFADLRLEPGTKLELHPVGADKPVPNWTVESVTAPGRLYGVSKAKVTATLAGFHTPAAKRTATLWINGKQLQSREVEVPENGRASVDFIEVDAPYGLNRGEVRIDSSDALKDDDRFYFALPRLEQNRVLLVSGGADKRSPIYIKAALEASANAAFSVDVASAGQASTVGLKKYSLVFLSDPGSISTGFESNLREYLKQGGGVFLALGPATALESRGAVMGIRAKPGDFATRGGDVFLSIASLDQTHPSLRSTGRWDGIRFYRSIETEAPGARVLARLSNESPLLLEMDPGQGRLVVFASSLDNISNDLPLNPVFVPFLEQTAYYLSGLKQGASTTTVDSFLDLRAGLDKGTQVEVVDAAGDRPLSLAESTSLQSFALRREGFYEIRRGAAPPELVAANADRRESDLAPAEPDTLELWKNTGAAPETVVTAGAVEAGEKPMTFWWWLLLALLIVGVAESVYAGRYLDSEREAA